MDHACEWLENPFSLDGKTVWVTGHNGLVGSALLRRLKQENCTILTVSRSDLDLRNQIDVQKWLEEYRPQIIIMAAAKVGGIQANINEPADFLYDNLMIQSNIIDGAYRIGAEKLLFLGSSCIYPKSVKNPIQEQALLTSELEPSNEPYALAKIAGLKMCAAYRKQYGCDFISAMPCSLYGPSDRFDKENSHVIPALLMKAHYAKVNNEQVFEIWGSGKPRREFLFSKDLADALIFLLKNYSSENIINIGSGTDLTIADLAREIMDVVGLRAKLQFDLSKPDGVMQKRTDNSKINKAGWYPRTNLKEGLKEAYEWFLNYKV